MSYIGFEASFLKNQSTSCVEVTRLHEAAQASGWNPAKTCFLQNKFFAFSDSFVCLVLSASSRSPCF